MEKIFIGRKMIITTTKQLGLTALFILTFTLSGMVYSAPEGKTQLLLKTGVSKRDLKNEVNGINNTKYCKVGKRDSPETKLNFTSTEQVPQAFNPYARTEYKN